MPYIRQKKKNYHAVVEEVIKQHMKKDQPVLVGTITIDISEDDQPALEKEQEFSIRS